MAKQVFLTVHDEMLVLLRLFRAVVTTAKNSSIVRSSLVLKFIIHIINRISYKRVALDYPSIHQAQFKSLLMNFK